MASASLEAWEIALNEGLSEQQQGLIFDKLKQASKPGHVVVADLWASLHRASAEKLKGAIIGRVPELEAGTPLCISPQIKWGTTLSSLALVFRSDIERCVEDFIHMVSLGWL